jgi:hypothetical protein
MNESNFLPMSQAMERSDTVLSHRELLYLGGRRGCGDLRDTGSDMGRGRAAVAGGPLRRSEANFRRPPPD